MSAVIDKVKQMVSGFHMNVVEALEGSGRKIETLRVKVITFRDFGCDSDALVSSPFYTMPDEKAQFQEYVNGIEVMGGENASANALEALAEAMNSEWTKEGVVQKLRRHIIVLFTNSGTIRLEDSNKDHKQYPRIVPANLADLHDWWEIGTPNGDLEERAKRLILFTPEAEPWDIVRTWNLTKSWVGDPGGEFASETLKDILATIAKNFGSPHPWLS